MVAYELSINGYQVYSLHDNGGDYISDLEQISKKETNAIVIIDSFSNYPDLIKHAFKTNLDNIIFILADRNSNSLKVTDKTPLTFIEHNIDLLTNNEINSAIKIIDNLAAWHGFSSLSHDRKFRLITGKYGSQISLLLLGLLNSPNIKNKIEQQTKIIYENPEFKKTVFAICVCEISNVEPTASLVSEISGVNAIFSPRLRNLDSFKQLFKLNGTTIKSKSSILSLSLLNNTFTDIYVRDSLLQIVERTDSIKFQDIEIRKVFKSLLRFNVVERILPQNQSALDRYYEQLKFRCTWLMESPHYWVQYAMCQLSVSNLARAQTYLTNAYEQAETKNKNYHTYDIDTQQARLYLNQCINNNNSTESYRCFELAHKLIESLPIDGRKFRQVLLYKKVFDLKFNYFSKKNKVAFEQAVKKMLEQTRQKDLEIQYNKQIRFIILSEELLETIIDNISNRRN